MKKKKIDIILCALGVFLVAFIVCMIVLFIIFQQVPDTLITAVLGGSGIEAIVCAVIKCMNIKHDKDNIAG